MLDRLAELGVDVQVDVAKPVVGLNWTLTIPILSFFPPSSDLTPSPGVWQNASYVECHRQQFNASSVGRDPENTTVCARMRACMDAHATREVYYSPSGVVGGLVVVKATKQDSRGSGE